MKKTMMKGAAITTLALIAAFAAADDLQVTVNGNPVNFEAAQPQMVQGRVLVPLRGVFEQMGASVDWDPSTQTVMADGNGRHVKLRIGSMDANVNGRAVSLDVPPAIMTGSTMVPLRFLGEALGARVDWQPENDLVAIVTRPHDERAERFRRNDNPPTTPPTIITPPPVTPPPTVVVPPPTVIIRDRDPQREVVRTPPPEPAPYVISRDTVIPLRLDQELTSNKSHNGERFTATVRGDSDRYMDLPDGTVVEGFVRDASGATGSHGGTLDLRFTHIRFPNGNRYPIDGVVTRLNDKSIVKTSNGRYVAKHDNGNNVARDAEIGAGAGLLIGSIKGKAVGGAVVGGALGALFGAFDKRMARNVIFESGTRFGLILDRDLTIERRDLRDRG